MGKDIALRCPRPRPSGRSTDLTHAAVTGTPHVAPLLRGADGAARRPYRPTLAFTIIEVMIAMGIFMMILVSIYSIWTAILRADQAARSAADSAQRARISMRALQDALTTAQMFAANMPPQTPQAYYSFLADMSGDYGTLSFVAHLPATFPGVGHFDHVVRRVKFFIKSGKDGNELWVEQGPMMQVMDEDFEPYSLMLAKNVTLFGFEFWGVNPKTGKWEWLEEWNSTNSLPALVHVGLGMGKTSKGESADVYHRYIALPASAVQPQWQMPRGMQPPGQGPGKLPGKP